MGSKLRESKAYRIWEGMRSRAVTGSHRSAKNYLQKGITACERWNSFENFFEDMGECPEGLTLERIDNSKGYTPENCKWASRAEQNRNHSRNRNYTYKGKTQCLTDWADEYGIHRNTLDNRLTRQGLSIEDALQYKLPKVNPKYYLYKDAVYTVPQLARKYKVAIGTLRSRLFINNWSLHTAVTTPVGCRRG